MDTRQLTDPGPLAELPEGTRLAIDTEFHAERHYTPLLHLIQIRAPGHPSWILDPHDPALLAACAPHVVRQPWLLHSGSHDLPLLRRAFGAVPEDVLDTQIAAGLVTPRWPAGLARLCTEWLGTTLDKGETLSDWGRRPLTPAQIAYAGADVALLHDLWDRLETRARDLGRADVIREACAQAAREALAGPDPDVLWREIPGHQTLSPRAAAILQELVAWREAAAAAEDQPPQALLANRVLMDLAKREPLTSTTLLAGRRAPRSVLGKHADAILEQIARAAARPEWGLPAMIAPGSLEAAQAAWLRAWAECAGARASWSARLVLTDAVILDRVTLGTPPTGWRATFLTPIAGTPGPLEWPA